MTKLTKLIKLALVATGIAAFAPAVQAKTYTLDLTTQTGETPYGKSRTIDGVTISCIDDTYGWSTIDWGSKTWEGADGTVFRFSLTSGANMTRIEMTCTVNDAEGENWSETSPGYVWIGNAKSVPTGSWFTYVTKIVVTSDEPDSARAPDYTADDGKDWLYNHAIAGKAYAGEAAESDVDLFYVYPTLFGNEQVVIDGFRGLDDKTMRSDEHSRSTAAGAFAETARCFADMTHVYAPFYRQATLGTAYDISTNAQGEVVSDANVKYLAKLCEGPAYGDVTNALTTYFTKWNNGRKLVLAAHSQGSALLRLVMKNYFTLPENQDKAKLIVCSYQIGFGVSAAEMSNVAAATGITFASDATGTNVIVSYNTMGEGSSGNSTLLPPDTIAINPITWTRGADLAGKSLNLGALTNALGKADVIVPHLYGAQVADTGFNRGEVVACKELNGKVLTPGIFGTGSLHGYDYSAFWEDLHKNCYDRITATTGKAPVVGKPMAYADKKNWMRLGDKSKTKSTAKPFDIFYLYPTSTGSSEYVAPVDENMQETALGNYRQAVEPLESYANVYAPYYRQVSATGIMADPTVDGLQQNIARHVGKTDLFAALDYYFTNVNAGVVRPFVLASHSQGSASLKNAFEQYFVGEKKVYLQKMIAAYTIGYTFPTDWCAKYGVTFATGAADKGVLMTWNAEGPNAPACSNMLTKDPNGQAINPLNWKRDETYAAITENLGSFSTNGTRVAGAADAQLKTARPGAVVVSNVTGYAYAPAAPFGAESYHFKDWAMFRENVCANILARGKDLTGYAKLCTTNFPKHLCVGNATVMLTDKSSYVVGLVGDTVWIPTNNLGIATMQLVPEKGYRLMFMGKEVESVAPSISSINLQPNGEFLITDKSFEKITVAWAQSAPDYTQAKDWVLHHSLKSDEARDIAGEPSQDSGVDLFYIYGTVAMTNAETTANGFADIDDPQMRGNEATHTGGVWGMIPGSVKAFSDYTHVYMPFYRQMTLCGATNAMAKVGMAGANQAMADALHDGVAYADITNALNRYFANDNVGAERPFILAGCSQGAAMLRNVIEHYFTLPENKNKLNNLVACYGIAYGVTKKWASDIETATGGKIHFATNATDAGVYISWNTVGPDSKDIPNGLVPPEAICINPLTWTTNGTPAAATLNLGSLTNSATGAIIPHLYDATVDTVNGVVVSTNLPASDYIQGLVWFGDKSLHGWEISAWWENLRLNAYQRIETATGRKPCCGTPTDYSDASNWMKKPTAEKGLDVFYLYPTCVPGSCTTLVGEIEDGMKAAANEHYKKGPSTFESYANVYAPYYRQGSGLALVSDLSPDGIQRFCSTHVVKTDVFAALDYFFTNINVNAERPFILGSHSQGSANMKNVFEEYFVGKKAAYTNKMVAAYVLGYKITPEWLNKVHMPFATSTNDTGVVMTWNAEGPGVTSDNFLTADPAQLAINPINWTTNMTEALKADNLGSVITNAQGILYNTGKPGVTGTRLQENRPGAVIVDAPETIPVGISPGFGTKSYHFEDWGFFHDNIGNNGFTRYSAFAGLARVAMNTIPTAVNTSWKVFADGQVATVSPINGELYAPKSASEVKVVYTLDATKAAEGYRFASGETTASFPMLYASKGSVWLVTEETKTEIKAATKTGKPKLQLGVVAQRYPWNGIVDVNYKTTYWPATGCLGQINVSVGGTSVTNLEFVISGNGVGVTNVDLRAVAPEIRGQATFRVVEQ